VLTAPSSGGDLQIVDLVRNGATVAAGDVVVAFDTTPQQRTVEQRQSEQQQAQSEVAKVESEGRRKVQAAEALLVELQSALAENLRVLRETQQIDEAMHGLTAAIHLMTARHGSGDNGPPFVRRSA